MIFSGIFEDVRIERLLVFEDAEDDVEELIHDGTEDDYFWLSLLEKALCKGFTNGVVTHGGHGWKEE